MRNLRVAGSFLTRVPLGVGADVSMPAATPWFPAVGSLVGLAGSALWTAGRWAMPTEPAAALTLAGIALITGAFHHDGLADVADAFGGGWTAEQRREILHDSRHGTYGVVSIVVVVLLQWSALVTLDTRGGVAALVAANVLGRSAILAVLLFGTPTPTAGMGANQAAGLSRGGTAVGLVAGGVLGASVLGAAALAAVPAIALTTFAVHALARRKIGGFSGDVLGTVEIVGETAVYLAVAALATHGRPPWL